MTEYTGWDQYLKQRQDEEKIFQDIITNILSIVGDPIHIALIQIVFYTMQSENRIKVANSLLQKLQRDRNRHQKIFDSIIH
jgi:hypothetical protein